MELTLDQALQKGVEAHKAGKAQEADRYYTAILKANPKHSDANHNMGVLAVGVNKVEEALPFFKTALEVNPNIAQYWLSYISALVKLDRITEAKAVFDQAKANGVKGDEFDQIEKQLSQLKKFEKKGQKTDKTRPNILDKLKLSQALQLAKKKTKEGNCKEARKIFQDIILKFPKNKKAIEGIKTLKDLPIRSPLNEEDPPPNQLNYLTKLYTLEEFDKVLKEARKVLTEFPASVTLFNLIGAANQGLGKPAKAIEAYSKAISIKPDYADAYNNIGNVLREYGEPAKAIEAYKKALSIKPDYAEAYSNKGVALQDLHKLEEAIEAYKKALSIKPDFAEVYFNMGLALQGLHMLEEAIEAYKKALSIKPDYAAAYNNIGNSLKEQGKLKAAVKAYNTALSIKPNHAEAYSNKGVALQDLHKLEQAIDAYKQALSIKPDFAEAYLNMGNALKDQGNLGEAIQAYNRAISLDPDYAEAIEIFLGFNNELRGTNFYSTDKTDRESLPNSVVSGRPKYLINRAIWAFLEANQSLAVKYLKEFDKCDPKTVAKLTRKDKVFCLAYYYFLIRLTESPFLAEPTSVKHQIAYHLGESHCLSYAHRKVKIQGIDYTITPKIIFGAKAFHFAREGSDKYKAITAAHFVSLPKGSNVFLSFGEIDCRPDEGFMYAAAKYKKPIEALITDTVRGYLNWFSDQNAKKNHNLFFFNIPAPFYDEKYSTEVNNQVANIVRLFNLTMEQRIADLDFKIIDVFRFTVGNNGFSNGLFHIDKRHLASNAINEIEKQICG